MNERFVAFSTVTGSRI